MFHKKNKMPFQLGPIKINEVNFDTQSLKQSDQSSKNIQLAVVFHTL